MTLCPSDLRAIAAIVFVLIFGCSPGNSMSRYVPAATTARKAIETALETWKSGSAHGPVANSKPVINVFDARWQAGAKLESYEILEEVKGEEHPQFKVRLKLEGKPEETLNYRVVGIDPLLVFRDADYQKSSGM